MRAYVEEPPSADPVTVEDANNWLRLDSDVADIDETLVESLITAAREYCENYCDRAFAAQTWRVDLDELRDMTLPGGRVGEIQSIKYTDTAGAEQTVAPSVYVLSRDGRLRRQYGQQWPEHRMGPDSASIVYTVGTDTVPAGVIQAMRLLIGHFYENRQSVVAGVSVAEMPMGVEALLTRHRMMSL